MEWEIINTLPIVPRCNFCDKTTDQMARIHMSIGHGITFYICSDCARYVKDCMNEWEGLKPVDYITGSEFNSDLIDEQLIGKSAVETKPKCTCGPCELHMCNE